MLVAKKKLRLRLVGLDGNAGALLAAFRRRARKEKWTDAEIRTVTTAAMAGDYNRLLSVLAEHCEDAGGY